MPTRRKWRVGWGAVAECNMRCPFCYSSDTREKAVRLSYEQWVRFVDENHTRIDSINYGTGENSTEPEWYDLVSYVRATYPAITQALTTNGYVSAQLERYPGWMPVVRESLDEIDVSLDFAEKREHNAIRGHGHAYAWALSTLDKCRAWGTRATIVFLGTPATLRQANIDGLFNIARHYGAKLRMNIYRPTWGLTDSTRPFVAPLGTILDILFYISRRYRVLSVSDPLFSSVLTEDAVEPDPSGINSLRILPNGDITPSTYLITGDFVGGNISAGHALDGIEATPPFRSITNHVIPRDCRECEFLKTCRGGVFDRRYLWYGTLARRDPYCPFNEGNCLPGQKIRISQDDEFSSVHRGYLPTMFFSS